MGGPVKHEVGIIMNPTYAPQRRSGKSREQEIADAVGLTQKTIHERTGELYNLDKCPKSIKLSAMFEEAAKAKENQSHGMTAPGKTLLSNSSKAFDQLRAEQARERQGARNDLNIPQTFGESHNPTPEPAKKKNETAVKIGELAGVSHLLHAAGDRGGGGQDTTDHR